MEVNGLHLIKGEIVYEVKGYFGPTRERYFTEEQEAIAEAKRLEKDPWSSEVRVVKQEMVYVTKD